jgi:hypothetical protein
MHKRDSYLNSFSTQILYHRRVELSCVEWDGDMIIKSEYMRIQKNAVVSYLMLLLQLLGEIAEILYEDTEQSCRDSSWIPLEYKSKPKYISIASCKYQLLYSSFRHSRSCPVGDRCNTGLTCVLYIGAALEVQVSKAPYKLRLISWTRILTEGEVHYLYKIID